MVGLSSSLPINEDSMALPKLEALLWGMDCALFPAEISLP